MGLNVLQLSDIHICGDNSPSASTLLLVGNFPKGAPDIVLVTGDLFDHSAFDNEENISETQKKIESSLNKAIEFCDSLIHHINDCYDTTLNRKSFLFVPGNHEIKRSAGNSYEYFQIYRLFLQKFYEEDIPNWYLDNLTFLKVFEPEKTIIIGLCSPHFEIKNQAINTPEEYDDYGLIDSDQLLEIKKELHRITNHNDYSIVVALHHQFILMEERDKSYVDKSYLRNSEQFIKFLAEENACIVLHGHKHVNSDRRLNIELDISKPEKVISILGCGSLSEKDNENWFNYITVYPQGYQYDFEYSSYKRTNAGYIPDKIEVKIPIVSKKVFSIYIKNAISDNPDLKKDYDVLVGYDTFTEPEKMFHIMDNTLLSLTTVVEQISNTPDLLYFILATAHYRYLLNKKAPDNIIRKVDAFISEKKKLYFSTNEVYDSISKISNIKNLAVKFREGQEVLNNTQKKIIVFSCLVTLIMDYYLIMKYRCEDFYKEIISKKIDFSYSETNLSSEFQGNSIEFKVDYERRLLEISLSCDTAEAIKICSLIVKEFEIILHDFERDFSDLGFKVYYILPKLRYNGKQKDEIESRQFTSYIPKLLPLLAGRNIYSKQEAFAREVIQNSIDAINVRKEHDTSFHNDGQIKITIGSDDRKGLSFFEIEDNGSGMTKYILERYLTTLGLSYYSENDYEKLQLQYNPISQFGIGFLSCFMLGKHIEVHTHHYLSEKGYYLDIPNYDGCFFIEEDKGFNEVGTKVRIWENPEQKDTIFAFDQRKIRDYLEQYIRNTSINIYLNNQLLFPKNLLGIRIGQETKRYKIHHFIPVKKDHLTGNWSASLPIDDNNLRFGVHFYKPDNELYLPKSNTLLLNDGILIPNFKEKELQMIKSSNADYYSVVVNFPPDTLNLDVSRDTLKNFKSNIDWNSIDSSFKELRNSTNKVNAPHYFLQKLYNPQKYSDCKLAFYFDQNDKTIKITYNDNYEYVDNSKNIILFLNYLSDGLYNKEYSSSINLFENTNHMSFTKSIIHEMFEAIQCISDYSLKEMIAVDATKKKYNNSILNIFFTRTKPFSSESMELANKVYDILKRYKTDSDNLKSSIIALTNLNKPYFDGIRQEIKSDITNMFKDRRYTAKETSKTHSSAAVMKIISGERRSDKALYDYFICYYKRAYTAIRASKTVSLIDVVGITISGIYSLLDFASIIVPIKELESGVQIKINRDDLEPEEKWFSKIKATH